jgi:hypothetical protein
MPRLPQAILPEECERARTILSLFPTCLPPETTRWPRVRIVQPVQRRRSQLAAVSAASNECETRIRKDPFAAQACKNLRLCVQDLCYRRKYEIRLQTRDPAIRGVARQRIVDQIDQNLICQIEEKCRLTIRSSESTDTEIIAEAAQQNVTRRPKFEETDRGRIARLQGRNKGEAERLIQWLFTELEIQQEEIERQQKEPEGK